jgi:hypothetical protein
LAAEARARDSLIRALASGTNFKEWPVNVLPASGARHIQHQIHVEAADYDDHGRRLIAIHINNTAT